MFEIFNLNRDNEEITVNEYGAAYLTLPSKKVSIGSLFHLGDNSFLYEKRVKNANIFKKSNSWGINYHILNNLGSKGKIRLYANDGKTYEINKETALKYGKFMNFKNQGFELQFFIPLERWEITK